MKKIYVFLLGMFSFCQFAVAGPEDPWTVSVVDKNDRTQLIGDAVIENIKFPDRVCRTNETGTESDCKEKHFEGGEIEVYADKYFGIKAVEITLKRDKKNRPFDLVIPLDHIYNFRVVDSVTKTPLSGVRIENTTYEDRYCETDTEGTGSNCTGRDLSRGFVNFSVDGYFPIKSYNLLKDKQDKDIEMNSAYKFRVINKETKEPLENVSIVNVLYPTRGCTTNREGYATGCSEKDLEGGLVTLSYLGKKYTDEYGSEEVQVFIGQELVIEFDTDLESTDDNESVETQDCQLYFYKVQTESKDIEVSDAESRGIENFLKRNPRFKYAVKLKGTIKTQEDCKNGDCEPGLAGCLIAECEHGWVPDATQKSCRDIRFEKIDEWIGNVDLSKDQWKDVSGKFNTARLTSDLTAGVVLGTVGGVVSGVVIKKKQVEKGFDALACYIGGKKMSDWGDVFKVVFTKE